jgi:hypothetical protein
MALGSRFSSRRMAINGNKPHTLRTETKQTWPKTASAKATSNESPAAKGTLGQVGQQVREVGPQTVSAAADL